MSFQRN